MPSWRTPVLALEPQLQQAFQQSALRVDYVRVALMEFSEPTVASVIRDCEQHGIDTVFAIPLFIAPSSHSEEDIPNLLGLQYNPKVVAALREEGTTLVSTSMRIVLGTPLSYSDVLQRLMLRQIRALSTDPANEAVLLLSHGDLGRADMWRDMMRSICNYVKDSTAITNVNYNFIAMGYYLADDITALIKKASAEKHRVLVQGVFLVSDMKSMAQMADMDKVQRQEFPDVDVVYSDQGILPSGEKEICQWILDQTRAFLNR